MTGLTKRVGVHMKGKILLLSAIILISTDVVLAQPVLKNGIFFELGGSAYYYSVNYERQWTKGLTGRIGVAYAYNTCIIPLTIGRIYGNAQHHFEFSGGVDLAGKSGNAGAPRYFLDITGFVGYRYQKPEKKLFLRAGFTPLWEVYESNYHVELLARTFYPWAGIGLGSRF